MEANIPAQSSRKLPAPQPSGCGQRRYPAHSHLRRGDFAGKGQISFFAKDRIMSRTWRPAVAATLKAKLLPIAVVLSFCGPARAADYTPVPAGEDLAIVGVPCRAGGPFWGPILPTAEQLPWASVWLGHFSGGRPYIDVYGQALVDWREEKLCFPSRAICLDWIREMRRAFHRPEGFWTCLLLR
ncbi:hypothetical protein CU048_10115 [Beijerinckiaceae bacterium]|nr:hypothetical protein CU048_10115 [Beijerinckiaceae bacterium]